MATHRRDGRRHLKKRADGRYRIMYQGQLIYGYTEDEVYEQLDRIKRVAKENYRRKDDPTAAEFGNKWLKTSKAAVADGFLRTNPAKDKNISTLERVPNGDLWRRRYGKTKEQKDVMEAVANKKLLDNRRAYGFIEEDNENILSNFKKWLKRLEAEGGSLDDIHNIPVIPYNRRRNGNH